jgi:hypothetical protein
VTTGTSKLGISRSFGLINADLSYFDTSGFDADVQDWLGPRVLGGRARRAHIQRGVLRSAGKRGADMLQNYVKKILSSRVYDVAVETPLQAAPNLSRRAGCT